MNLLALYVAAPLTAVWGVAHLFALPAISGVWVYALLVLRRHGDTMDA